MKLLYNSNHSDSMFVCFQPGGRSTKSSATQVEEKAMASGQEIHWPRQMALLGKLHICSLSVVYLSVVVMK